MEDRPRNLRRDLDEKYRVFCKACSQVILLNHQLEAVKARYDRARVAKRLSFRYSNRLKLTTLESVRDLIYKRASQLCDEIDYLQERLRSMPESEYDSSDSEASETDVVTEEETESGNDAGEEEIESEDDASLADPPRWINIDSLWMTK